MMERIETLLRDAIGLDAASVGIHVVQSAVRACMRACGVADVDAYADLLSDPRELERLIAAVAVPESSFFRDPASFTYLRQFVMQEWRGAVLRVLSVPCAAGEEPYSIAITLLDAGLPATRFTIDAVDVRASAIACAQAGLFRPSAFRNDIAHAARARHFDGWSIRPGIRERVRFHTGNLLDPSLLAGRTFDVVFCKNLLIYFTADARTRALAQLKRFLAPGGRLFVGASEIGWLHASGTFTHAAAPSATALLSTGVGSHPAPVLNEAVPRSEDLTLADARALAGRGKLREAHEVASAWLRRNGPSDDTYALLGLLAFACGRDAEGRHLMERALYLNPDNVEALTFLAIERERDGDGASAERLRDRARRAEATHVG